MKVIVKNETFSVQISLTVLKLIGLWAPTGLDSQKKLLYNIYAAFCFVFLLGAFTLLQLVELTLIWGDLPLMTGIAFLMFTNLAQAAKIVNLVARREKIQAIISEADDILSNVQTVEENIIVESCNRETKTHLILYIVLTTVTLLGWASSAEKARLPLPAWYPYDTMKSPAFELTYVHQVFSLFVAAYLNVGKDTLVVSLIAQCRCRLKLLRHSLKTLCRGLDVPAKKYLLTPNQESILSQRLQRCVCEHQATLEAAQQLQNCFSEPTFAQFTVSLIIICVTAFQMVSNTSNPVRLASMGTYLMNMMFQVFLYCYHGNQLSEESTEIAGSAYESEWYTCGLRVRREILVLMTRCRRVSKFSVGSFTTLSLATFMAMIKASYSLFTLLQQVDEQN